MSLSERLKDPLLFRQQAFVAGAWVNADGGATIPVTDPATGAEIGTVPALGAEESRRAIKAAEEAWPAWRALPSSERGHLLGGLVSVDARKHRRPRADHDDSRANRWLRPPARSGMGPVSSNGSRRRLAAFTATLSRHPPQIAAFSF
jgi:hypothetical protein